MKRITSLRGKSIRQFVALALGLLLATASSAGEIPHVTISGERIRAGDLARVLPIWAKVDPATPLGYAPRAGLERRLRPAEILAWARSAGLHIDSAALPAAILVSRRMKRLDAAAATETLRGVVAERYHVSRERVQVSLENFSPPRIPAGEMRFELTGNPRMLDQPAIWTLRWKDSEGGSGRLSLRARVAISGRHAVARRDLPTGTRLGADDFLFQDGPLPGPPDRFLIDPAQVSGKQLRHGLKAGEGLRTDLLVEDQTIRRGDLIQLQLRAGAIQLLVPARAEQAGSVGDPITCRNLESGRRVTARIIDARLAEVVLRP